MGPHIEHHWFGSGFNFRHTRASLPQSRDLLFENDRTWLEDKQGEGVTRSCKIIFSVKMAQDKPGGYDDAIAHIQRHNPVG